MLTGFWDNLPTYLFYAYCALLVLSYLLVLVLVFLWLLSVVGAALVDLFDGALDCLSGHEIAQRLAEGAIVVFTIAVAVVICVLLALVLFWLAQCKEGLRGGKLFAGYRNLYCSRR